MLRVAGIVFCDQCDAPSARTERGWRAYIVADVNDEGTITIVCPACAERRFGEDEAAWSD
jgi:hypothetical protein